MELPSHNNNGNKTLFVDSRNEIQHKRNENRLPVQNSRREQVANSGMSPQRDGRVSYGEKVVQLLHINHLQINAAAAALCSMTFGISCALMKRMLQL
ncbi:hypothetical protein CEXT_383141 [Caerostris extrusa]|uniref:Uncharacterized protein n=1 Tax=Caerostris extrusa TaxID=172846 RepID=A0AAV4NY52_CAEEX|nr:hypothetical protein CEXT_383141 [Caerostris extrusa]